MAKIGVQRAGGAWGADHPRRLRIDAPGIDGRQLLAWLRQARPELVARLAFTTGDALGSETARFLAEAGRPVLAKPFTRAALRRVTSAVRRA